MTAHSELLARLEGASEGSQSIDAEICIALQYGGLNSEGGENIRTDEEWEGDLLYEIGAEECCCPIPPVTTSLDAALALASRVYPCWSWSVGQNVHHKYWRAYALALDTDRAAFQPTEATAKAPELALCIAILKATATQPSDDGEKT